MVSYRNKALSYLILLNITSQNVVERPKRPVVLQRFVKHPIIESVCVCMYVCVIRFLCKYFKPKRPWPASPVTSHVTIQIKISTNSTKTYIEV